jgi:hypothetical protein
LLILAIEEKEKAHPWLETVAPDCLLPENIETTRLTLANGEVLGYEHWTLAAADEVLDSDGLKPTAKPLYWFVTPDQPARQPLNFSASGAEPVPCQVLECVQIGERIQIANQPDMGLLGTALHACIGASFSDPQSPLDEAEMAEILDGFDVLENIPAKDALRQTKALQDWIRTRWPTAQTIAEVPIELTLANGQNMNGRIDLLLKLPEGWVLIDHKSSQLGAEKWPELAGQYSGQLAAYAGAVERTTRLPVLEKWLYLPVAGGAVQIQ